MSRRKRGRAQTPPQGKPTHKGDAPELRGDDALRLKLGGAELTSALRLEIEVAPAPPAVLDAEDAVPQLELIPTPVPLELLGPMAEAADPASEANIEPVQANCAATSGEEPGIDWVPRVEPVAPSRPLGLRFADARVALGLGQNEIAKRLRVPLSVVADIEAERFEALGAPIYARGYLRSYARLVQLPEAAVARVLAGLVEQAEQPLQPALSAQPRPLAPRFATPALYALLTLLLVVPVAVQLYQRSRLPDARTDPRGSADTSVDTVAAQGEFPLESRSVATVDHAPTSPVAGASDTPLAGDVSAAPGAAGGSDRDGAAGQATPDPRPASSPAHSAEPVLASLAPMPARNPVATGQHVLLKLAESSWVELIGADGSRIEYAMLPAGTAREYQVAGKASLRIGNTRGASLSVDGKELDLAAFSRGNVARVNLGDAEPPSPSGNP